MSNFYKGLLPWLTLLAGGTVFIQYFLRVKFEYRKQRRGEMQYLGLNSNASLEQLYKEMVENQDLDSWSNVRGPRSEEDNAEFDGSKEQRKRELDARREQFRARREEFQRRLERQQK